MLRSRLRRFGSPATVPVEPVLIGLVVMVGGFVSAPGDWLLVVTLTAIVVTVGVRAPAGVAACAAGWLVARPDSFGVGSWTIAALTVVGGICWLAWLAGAVAEPSRRLSEAPITAIVLLVAASAFIWPGVANVKVVAGLGVGVMAAAAQPTQVRQRLPAVIVVLGLVGPVAAAESDRSLAGVAATAVVALTFALYLSVAAPTGPRRFVARLASIGLVGSLVYAVDNQADSVFVDPGVVITEPMTARVALIAAVLLCFIDAVLLMRDATDRRDRDLGLAFGVASLMMLVATSVSTSVATSPEFFASALLVAGASGAAVQLRRPPPGPGQGNESGLVVEVAPVAPAMAAVSAVGDEPALVPAIRAVEVRLSDPFEPTARDSIAAALLVAPATVVALMVMDLLVAPWIGGIVVNLAVLAQLAIVLRIRHRARQGDTRAAFRLQLLRPLGRACVALFSLLLVNRLIASRLDVADIMTAALVVSVGSMFFVAWLWAERPAIAAVALRWFSN